MKGKRITASVGLGGKNIPSDIATVQYLLNCVPVSEGGPQKELVVDGHLGVLTQQAINRFLQVQLGNSDGRINPEQSGGKSIIRLKEFDPLPFSSPIVAPEGNLFTPKVEKGKMMTPKVERGKMMTPKVERGKMMTPKVEKG